MATIIWAVNDDNESEKIAVFEGGEIDNGSETIKTRIRTENGLKRWAKKYCSTIGMVFDGLQSGIKREYAWEVDEDGNLP